MSPSVRHPTAQDLETLQQFIARARFLDAWDFAEQLEPPVAWLSPEARLLAGRLVSHWGDKVLSRRIHEAYFRAYPTDLSAILFAGYDRVRRHGPLEGWLFLRGRCPPLEEVGRHSSRELARLWSYQGVILGHFHDFEAALHWSDAAVELNSQDEWIWVDRAAIRQLQDDYAGALRDLEEALRLHPAYRAALEQQSQIYRLQNREAESLALLRKAVGETQNPYAAQLLAAQESDAGLYREAGQTLDRLEQLLPMADNECKKWIRQNRVNVAYHLGLSDEAVRYARECDGRYFSSMVEKLSAADAIPRRTILPVSFVRQHHQTCAPATMSAIASFWGCKIDHMALAAVITYDGTPDHEERHWMQSNGWVTREFRVTWESAVALIDRGCPFTLTTAYTRSAHLQAIVGYDARLKTLIIRDPYWMGHSEMLADEFFSGAASYGPRGHVFVPRERAELLEDLDLPDAVEYDLYFNVQRAIVEHRRGDAAAIAAELAKRNPGHLLAIWAQRDLAHYDGNPIIALECVRELRTRHAENANYQLDQLWALRQVGRTVELQERLAEFGSRPGADPLIWRELVEESLNDATRLPRNLRIARRLIRRRPADGDSLRLLANLLWVQADFSRATEVYRLAACLDDAKGYHWDSYFTAARLVGRTDECLQLLRLRYERLGERSDIPVKNLVDALVALDRHAEAQTVMQEAREARPSDGELALYAARLCANRGDYTEAGVLLEQSRPLSNQRTWLRTAAQIATLELDYTRALELWREVLKLSPIDQETHSEIARLLVIQSGVVRAVEYIDEERAKHPTLLHLLRTKLEWQRSGDPQAVLRTLEEILAMAPNDAWAWREKASHLSKLGKHGAALSAAARAIELDPNSPYSQSVLGSALAKQRQLQEAKEAYKTAFRLRADSGWVMPAALLACATRDEQRAALEFFYTEMQRQHLIGDSPIRLAAESRGLVPPEEIAGWLAKIDDGHPNEWQARAARISHCRECGFSDEARRLAEESLVRFQAVPEIWLEVASCRSASRDVAGELEALERAHRLRPNAVDPVIRLALLHEQNLSLEKALNLLQFGVRANPLDAALQAHLSDILWKRGNHPEAITGMERALRLAPQYNWAWTRLHDWHVEKQRPAATIELAEKLAAERPGDAEPWLQLARLFSWQGKMKEALAAVDHGLQLDRFKTDAYDQRAEFLAALGRYDEAVEACQPPALMEYQPRELRGRRAWLEAQRGHHATAVTLMSEVVADHPDYYWGWSMLAEWHDAKTEYAKSIVAARRMIELSPQSPQGWCYVAKAEKADANRDKAKTALAEAARRAPTFFYSTYQLFRMQLEDREFEQAAGLIVAIRLHFGEYQGLRCEADLYAAKRDQEATMRVIRQLVSVPSNQGTVLREAVEAAMRAGWAKAVDECLCQTLGDSATNAEAGALWVNSWIERRSIWRLRQLIAPPESELWARAYVAVVGHLGEKKRTWLLRFILWRKGAWLRHHGSTWGEVSFALATNFMSRRLRRWARDWDSRTDLQPWMLLNLTDALMRLGLPLEATAVVRRALRLAPDGTRSGLEVWQAYLFMLEGEAGRARALLLQHKPTELQPFYGYLHGLAEAGVMVQEAPATKRVEALREAKSLIENRRDQCEGSRRWRFHLGLYRRALRRMGTDADDWRTRVRSYVPSGVQFEGGGGQSQFSQNWWVIWVAIVILGQLARGCSGN